MIPFVGASIGALNEAATRPRRTARRKPTITMKEIVVWLAFWCACTAAIPVKCRSHDDATGCRSGGDLVGLEQPLINMSKAEQVVRCGALCCAEPKCDAWAVHEEYTAGWAKNCPSGSDCCLLKGVGWSMQGTQPDCTSGGRSATPTPTPVARGGGKCTKDWDCSFGGS